jgi:hypothetical protein
MPHMVKHGPFHADYAIRERAVVVVYVPKIKDCEHDEQSYENSHLISLSWFVWSKPPIGQPSQKSPRGALELPDDGAQCVGFRWRDQLTGTIP